MHTLHLAKEGNQDPSPELLPWHVKVQKESHPHKPLQIVSLLLPPWLKGPSFCLLACIILLCFGTEGSDDPLQILFPKLPVSSKVVLKAEAS